MLLLLLIIPLAGGLLALLPGRRVVPRFIALLTMIIELALTVYRWLMPASGSTLYPWIDLVRYRWIDSLGATFFLGMDGLSLLMVLLTAFVGLFVVLISWNRVDTKESFYYFNILWTIAFVNGLFLALDLLLFYVFWELMLVPVYFLIALWGHEQRRKAALTFFMYTQASGLLMLLGIVIMALMHASSSGTLTFDYLSLRDSAGQLSAGWLIMMGFFVAFAVKMGIVPFHGWVPLTYSQAPPAVSVLLAAILAKTGVYGLLRFVIPLFPNESGLFTTVAFALGLITVFYGALSAFGQSDIKRFIAWSSISHMGFLLLGVYAWNLISLQGTVLQMLSHSITIGALFIIAAALIDRTGTREIARMGGFWKTAPFLGAASLVFSLAAMALPGSGNFLGEFLILLGTFRRNMLIASLGAGAIIASAVYALWMVHRVFQGPLTTDTNCGDLSKGTVTVLAVFVGVILWLGLNPSIFIATSTPALVNLRGATVELAREPARGTLAGRVR